MITQDELIVGNYYVVKYNDSENLLVLKLLVIFSKTNTELATYWFGDWDKVAFGYSEKHLTYISPLPEELAHFYS